ncbi:MAG: hypothetical protein ACRDTM_06190 [Micromonosporaceae bacterium]
MRLLPQRQGWVARRVWPGWAGRLAGWTSLGRRALGEWSGARVLRASTALRYEA